MLNLDKDDQKKVICGTIIGSIIAVGALSIYCATKKSKNKSSLQVIGSTIAHMVEKLDHCKEEAHCAVHKMEEKIKENEDVISDIFELASIGINIWKKIKKG